MRYLASPIQAQFWLLQELSPMSSAYNMPVLFKLDKHIDINKFESAVNKTVQSHEILRTKFELSGENLYQVVENHLKIKIDTVEEFSKNADSDIDDSTAFIAEYCKFQFKSTDLPLFKIFYFHFKNNKPIVLFLFHHLISDLETISIFLKEISILYNETFIKIDKDKDIASNQYRLYSEWHNKLLNGDEYGRMKDFWISELSAYKTYPVLPTEKDRPTIKGNNGDELITIIDSETTENIFSFNKEHNTNTFLTLLSAFYIVLKYLFNRDSIILGIPFSNRRNPHSKNMLGCFASILPVPMDIDHCETFEEITTKLRKKLLFTHRNQEMPFESIVTELNPSRNTGINPLYQIGCTMEPITELRLGNSISEKMDIYRGSPQLDIFCVFRLDKNGIICRFEYDTDLYTPETIKELCEFYTTAVHDLVQSSNKPVSHHFSSKRLLPHIEKLKKGHSTNNEKQSLLSIAISATFTIELIEPGLSFWMDKLKTPHQIVFTPYNQVFQQLLDPSSFFNKNPGGIKVIFIRFDDWTHQNALSPLASVKKNASDFSTALNTFSSNKSTTCLIVFCPLSRRLSEDTNIATQLSFLEKELCTNFNKINGVYCVPSDELQTLYPTADYDEPLGEDIGHIPYSQDFFDALSTLLSRKIHSVITPPYKVIILDCDNTLWDGIVGEDGVLGVKISSSKKRLQEFLITQYHAGMVICLCSKNNEADVANVLEQHPDMVLRKTHIAAQKINWSPKSKNIIELSKELNLGLDSFIFIDDNPIECAEVKASCPEVLVIQLPSEENELASLFSHMWAFDHLKVTSEDAKRSEFYKTDHQRKSYLQQAASFADFIHGLNLKISFSDIDPSTVSRVSQLTQRTNQFNMTTIRRSESDIIRLSQTEDYHIKTVNVSDKFGNYGLVGVIIAESDASTLKVDSFILSCRALGKGVEHEMAAHLGRLAEAMDIDYIDFSYIPTERNTPAKAFLDATICVYAKHTNGRWGYRVPTAVTSAIHFQPASVSENSEKERSEGKKNIASGAATPQAESRGQILLDIAKIFSNITPLSSFIHPIKKVSPAIGIPGIKTPSVFDSVASVSKTELHVAEIWRTVLRLDRIDPDDKFFEIGGKSVLIPQIVIQLKKKYDQTIRIVDVFQYPTIRSLSAFIDQKAGNMDDRKPIKNNALLKQKQRAQKVRNMFQGKRQ